MILHSVSVSLTLFNLFGFFICIFSNSFVYISVSACSKFVIIPFFCQLNARLGDGTRIWGRWLHSCGSVVKTQSPAYYTRQTALSQGSHLNERTLSSGLDLVQE